MTDFQKKAKAEIALINDYDKKILRLDSASRMRKLFDQTNKKARHFRDVDNNEIGDFFADNAKDNLNLGQKPTKEDYHLMAVAEIKAIKGDEKTLLNE